MKGILQSTITAITASAHVVWSAIRRFFLKPRTLTPRTLILAVLSLIFVGGGYGVISFASQPPAAFPLGKRIEVPAGTSLIGSARLLSNAHVVRSTVLLELLLVTQAAQSGVKAGTYWFDQPLSVFEVARALIEGTHGVPLVRVTIPEGLRNTEIDEMVHRQLPAIPAGAFVRAADGKEGYLLPETYYVPETFTAEELVSLMKETFEKKATLFREAAQEHNRVWEDVIIMASILEREGDTEESKRAIAGILWRRIAENMPLQVDASFSYLLGKTSKQVTRADLKTDSPYNTYKYKGLPPTPLNNPGLKALAAAASASTSPYLYFLTGSDGLFHYAQTFDEHKKNRQHLD